MGGEKTIFTQNMVVDGKLIKSKPTEVKMKKQR